MAEVRGTQSLRRGLGLLALMASKQGDDFSLSELVLASKLGRATAYRMVSALVDEGFVQRDPLTKRYKLGLQAMQLGLVAVNRSPLVEKCQLTMRRLARISEDTVFLVVRHGDYALCLHREEGSFPIRALITDVGQRRLLGIGAAGRAILAELPDQEIDAIYGRHSNEFQSSNIELADLRVDVRSVRERGYSVMQDVITVGVAGIGCSFSPSSSIIAAISIAAITSRQKIDKQLDYGYIMIKECQNLKF